MAQNGEISIEVDEADQLNVDEWGRVDEADQLNVDKWARVDPTVKLQRSSLCYIHKVPRKLRVDEEDKYEPYTISIGPYHRRKSMEVSETHKKLYLHSFMLRCRESDITWRDVVTKINGLQDAARKCYSEIIDLDDEEFGRMLLLDGCFILELLYKYQEKCESEDDILFSKSWLVPSIRHDLVLLENQIPLSVLECLFDLTHSTCPQTSPLRENDSPNPSHSLKKTVTKWFSFVSQSQSQPSSPIHPSSSTESSSLNKLVISFFDPILPTIKEDKIDSTINAKHLLDLLRKHLLQPSQTLTYDKGDKPFSEHTTCATDLHEAGVHFKIKCSSRGLLDINFTDGTFEIPPFYFGESWTILIPNIIALEQCRHDYKDEITSYALLMDNLIDSHNDVKLLREAGIIGGSTKEDETVAQAVNNLCKKAIVENFLYDGLCSEVNAYRKTTIHTWRAAFMRKVVHTPWAGVSVLAAVTLLGLTITQTVFAVLSWVIAKKDLHKK